jgi:ABC-type bacteriocin/lantibiotic exporter with double-glycine peptidase domain
MVKKSIYSSMLHLAGIEVSTHAHFRCQYHEQASTVNNIENIDSFVAQSQQIAEHFQLHFDLKSLGISEFAEFISEIDFPILVFKKKASFLEPVLIKKVNADAYELIDFETGTPSTIGILAQNQLPEQIKNCADLKAKHGLDLKFTTLFGFNSSDDNAIVFATAFKIITKVAEEEKHTKVKTPIKRFFELVKAEKRDIYLIYFFAILVSIITLTIPLGIQAIIGLMSGGLLLESVMVLIFLVIMATLVSGWLQVQQLALVEILQQRIFTKTAFDFSYRIPRIKSEALSNFYTPELVNRFFDVLNVQKSLPKILIDFTSALIQIFFGLLLLSFYHPYFILFGLLVIGVVAIVFMFTGKAGLDSSIYESKYKYKLAFWLEELGRTVHSFKLSAYTGYSVSKTDHLLNKYLFYRKKHFKVLVKQFSAIVAFKTLITAGLLILGGLLVFQKKINLGQFVASEIIILLVINSVEKIISNVSSVYDLLTAIDKVASVSDLPLERTNGRMIDEVIVDAQFELNLQKVGFAYPDSKIDCINELNLQIKKGQKIAICGYNDSGKTTLLKLIAGVYESYTGSICVNGVSLRELNLSSYRNLIADVGNANELFEGTIEENISMGNHFISFKQILDACEWADLTNFISNLNEGLQTKIAPAAANFPSNIAKKILLARAYLSKPKLLLLDDFFHQVQRKDKLKIIDALFHQHEIALLMITSQKEMLEKADYVYIMQSGTIIAQGTFAELTQKNALQFFTNQ